METVEEIPKRYIFKPNPGPQEAFFEAPEREVLYGGSAGSGKSYALLIAPLRYTDNPTQTASDIV